MNNKAWQKSWEEIDEAIPYNVSFQWSCLISVLDKSPKTLLDIGPGRVWTEAWLARNEFPDCYIIGFEPQPERCQMLRDNNYPGVLLQSVVANNEGFVTGYMGYKGGKSDFWLYGGDSVRTTPMQPACAFP